tara:strand:- start:112 stop:354 length:243 start_codon:yes stop_codon:yes gene_type:complete
LLVVLGAEEGSSLTLIVGAILKDGIELGTLLGCELGYSVAKMSVISVTSAPGIAPGSASLSPKDCAPSLTEHVSGFSFGS